MPDKNEQQSCCFFGHRKIDETEELKNNLYKIIENLIVNDNVNTFFFGSKSEFDDLCHKTVTVLKEKYPHIRRIYVRAAFLHISDFYEDMLLNYYEGTYFPEHIKNAGRASYVERNQEMINRSKFCVVYYDENYLPPRRKNSRRDLLDCQPKSGTKVAYDYAVKKKKEIVNVFKGEQVMANKKLSDAKIAKNDEFYTQYEDIQREINAYIEYNPDVFKGKTVLLPCDDPEWSNFTKFFAQNFENFGLKKLISTSFAAEKSENEGVTSFEENSPQFDRVKTKTHGKIFTLTGDSNKSGNIDIDDLEWEYLEGDGDFRSDEVKALRDEADIIVTNPPFSLFREFLAWITEADREFVIIGNMNAITYKEVFPLIRNNKMWLGNGFGGGNAYFKPFGGDMSAYANGVYNEETGLVKFRNCCWFTNLEHGRRHQPLSLMTMDDNIKFSKHKEIRNCGYKKYDNYDAIEIPYTDSIPSDFDGVMGVPISFLPKYCPEQFEIVWQASGNAYANAPKEIMKALKFDPTIKYGGGLGAAVVDGKAVYSRILIRKKVSE